MIIQIIGGIMFGLFSALACMFAVERKRYELTWWILAGIGLALLLWNR
jgi:uncharacterized membrane protein YesL